MACAVWPALKTLIITGNPIISLNKGNLVEYQDMHVHVCILTCRVTTIDTA